MSEHAVVTPGWLIEWMQSRGLSLWGAADLRGFSAPGLEPGSQLPYGISFALPVNPEIMAGVRNGPNDVYAVEYERLNLRIDELTAALSSDISARGHAARPLSASQRTDFVNIKGAFPHKTVATRAGLGWIGRHCQVVTRPFGPWIRFGSVFTDMELPFGTPIEKGSCGNCMRCVEVCPAKALKGNAWHAGLPREELLDVKACDGWKKEHYMHCGGGHICGICTANCPYGLKTLR